jgi:hypothetical protein
VFPKDAAFPRCVVLDQRHRKSTKPTHVLAAVAFADFAKRTASLSKLIM